MRRKTSQLPLTRRIVGHYLMCGLASVLAVVITLPLVAGWLLDGDRLPDSIERVRQCGDALTSDFSTNAGSHAQQAVERFAAEEGVGYAAVIGRDGVYLAHSKRGQIGTRPSDASRKLQADSPIEYVRHFSDESSTIGQYRMPLAAGSQYFGQLEVGMIEKPHSQLLAIIHDLCRPAAIIPAIVIALGSCLITRSVGQVGQIELQLRHLSVIPESINPALSPLSEVDAASAGWNRLVQRVTHPPAQGNLPDRLRDALSGFKAQKAERILNGLSDGIAATGQDGCVTYANRAFRAVLGLGDRDLESTRLVDLLPLEKASNAQEIADQLAQESRPIVFELQRSENQADGVLRVSRVPLLQEGQPTIYSWSLRDVTQQKLAEEMRNQFVVSATHELRTPLANIKAYAETLSLEEMGDVEQQKMFLNTISVEATRLARFVDDLLNISRMEAGSLVLQRQETNVERVFHEVAEKVQAQMDLKQIHFEIKLPPKAPELQLDKDKFVAALVNLLGNAAKYTPEGGRVTFSAGATAHRLEIHVEDSGIGISESELPKIFDKFFRSEDDRVREIPGSGLGLAFVQEVARLHGATLDVHSELNKGTKFTLSLPLA